MRYWSLGVLGVLAVLLLATASQLPALRRVDNPISGHVEQYYVGNAMRDTATPNLVTAILADYRGYDTFGETVVIFAAGLACYFLLRRSP